LMAGLNPNQALVFGLQARGDQLISRDFLRRQMPWEINVTMEEQKIEVEKMRDSLLAAVSGLAQSLPALVQSGQDPSQFIGKLAAIIDGRLKGDSIESIVASVFAPEPPPSAPGSQPAVPGSPEEAAAAAGGGVSGLNPLTGSPTGVAPGQVGVGGKPPIQYLLAGLTSRGKPTLASSVTRMMPAG